MSALAEIGKALDRIDSLAEMRQIQSIVRERWRRIQRTEALEASSTMRPGTRVKFFARGMWVHAVVEHWNAKTARVKADDGRPWRVSAGSLQAA